jgi:hypothetical protein
MHYVHDIGSKCNLKIYIYLTRNDNLGMKK